MKFTSEEVEEYVCEHDIETKYGENRRWSRSASTIVERDGKFYRLVWENGLTEEQPNEYEEQEAVEVKQIEEIVTIKKWVKV